MLFLLAFFALGGIGRLRGGIFLIVSMFLILFVLAGLAVFGIYWSSSRGTQAIEPMVDSITSPTHREETTPEDVGSETAVLSCPDCGYKNPADADFCIRCGRDLDVTDDVARY